MNDNLFVYLWTMKEIQETFVITVINFSLKMSNDNSDK